jgi:hypothetical protein
MHRLLAILFTVFILFSCKKDIDPIDVDLGYEYQPLEVGYWVEYDVDSIFFDDFTGTVDTYFYQRREFFESEFLDLNGETNVRVEQSIRNSPQDAWAISYIGSFKQTTINLQKVEYDLRFIKFAFPPVVGKQWQGHIYINTTDQPSLEYLDRERYEWNFTFTKVNEPAIINGFSFDATAEILQIDQENLFEKKYSKEVYAKNVGMVSKEMIILETQAPPINVPFIDRAEKGFIVRYTISNFKQ